jgi:hypothetical protein
MTELQTIVFGYIAVIALRFPRIKERWAAPLLRGPEWFFDVSVPPDFLQKSGRVLLRYYRWRLFIPWGIEFPLVAALALTGQFNLRNVAILILIITLFTRFNYYAARIAAEKRARAFEQSVESSHTSGVMLSLQPRTLRNYTNWWVEAGIVLALSAATGSLAVGAPDRALRFVVINLYLQAGLLLIKYGIIRSSGAAPVDNVEQYLTWRESLRRLSTGACDTTRLMFAVQPIIALGFLAGGTARWVAWIAFAVAAIVIVTYQWRCRRKHLAVARRTKPARLPLLPDFEQIRSVLGFWPSLPLLLLKTANGYALNLASAPVRLAGLYFAGFAGLWLWLVH